MKTIHNFKLIEGDFLPVEAGKVLSGLINFKIDYHKMELFSNEERFGQDLSNSKKRLQELKAAASYLDKIVDFTAGKAQSLHVSCSVEITILEGD